MADALIGENLGQYEIRMLLGKGGMATVYLAYQPSMDRVVAVKVLPREFLHDDTFLARFKREVHTIAKLEHPHILPVYDVGEADGLPYYVMRYLAGGTLADLIDSKLPGTGTILRVAGQIASALDYAHERGIVHRDLKPSNVLLDNKGNAYLADFGIARIQKDVRITDESRMVGTPSYIAPEMVRQGEPVTHAVDIYALGAITYEMFTGDPPYAGDDPMTVVMAHVLEPIPSIRDFDPNISRAVDAVVQRSLAKSPSDRYPTAGEFVRDLARASEAGLPTLEMPPVGGDGSAGRDAASAVPEDTQPGLPAVPATPAPPRPYYDPAPPYTAPPPRKQEQPRPRRFRLGGCAVALGVILALLAGMVISAFAMTDGDPLSLLNVLTPIFTREPRSGGVVVTPAPGGGADAAGDQVAVVDPALTPQEASGADLPAPGSGARLAFTSNRDGDYEIYLIELDGSNVVKLTDNDTYDFDPDWSPDGTRLVYATTIGGYSELVVMGADGSNKVQITDNREIKDADPAWSPLGDRIAFSSDRDGDFDIYTVRTDGSDLQQVTSTDRLDDLNPTWSPDGTQIAYYARDPESGATELFVVPAAGGDPQRLTDNFALDQWPDWSPDGTRLAYTSSEGLEGGQRAVFALDLATGQTTRLTDGTHRDDDPVWSPDGRFIAFDSDRDGDGVFDLYVLDLDTGEVRRLTSEDANDVAPAWQPLP